MDYECIELRTFSNVSGNCDTCPIGDIDSAEFGGGSVVVGMSQDCSCAGLINYSDEIVPLADNTSMTRPVRTLELTEVPPEGVGLPDMMPMTYFDVGFPINSESVAYAEVPFLGIRRRIVPNNSINLNSTDSGDTRILVLKIAAAVCLLFSIIIFLCVLDDIYCLIPASCLLAVSISSCIALIALNRRGIR